MDKGLKLAIEAAGSARRLAAKLGVSQQAVQQWERIPAERLIEVERLTPTRPLNFALALFAF